MNMKSQGTSLAQAASLARRQAAANEQSMATAESVIYKTSSSSNPADIFKRIRAGSFDTSHTCTGVSDAAICSWIINYWGRLANTESARQIDCFARSGM